MTGKALLPVLGSLVPAGRAGTQGSAGPWLPGRGQGGLGVTLTRVAQPQSLVS